MQKKFLTNLALIIALNLVVKPFALFGIDATIQNRVGAEEYGLYFSLLNLSFLFNIVMDLGINNYTTRNIAQYPHLVSRYLGKIFSFRLILFLVYCIITFTIALIAGYRGHALYLLLILIFNQLLVTFIAYFRSHFGGLHLFKTDAFISVLDRVLLIIIAGSVLYFSASGQHFEIEWFIWMQTFCYAFTLVIAFILLLKKTGIPQFKFSWVFSMVILRKSYPYALLILLMMIYTRTDSIMLERLHAKGSFEAGVYAQGFRLLDAFFIFGMIFANLLLPIFSRLLKNPENGIAGLLKSSRNLLVGASVFIAFVCHYNAEIILNLIYVHEVNNSILPFQFLMWSFVGLSISLIYGTLITAGGNLRFLNQLSFVGILINIVLNFILIPTYGAAGAAFTTLITQSIIACIQLIYCNRQFGIPFSFRQILNYLGFALILFLVPLFINEGHFQLFMQLSVGIVGMFIFSMIDLKEIKIAIKEKL